MEAMRFYESVFYVGSIMMAASVLLGILAGILLKRQGGKLQHLLDSEYGPQAKQQKAPRKTGKQLHKVEMK